MHCCLLLTIIQHLNPAFFRASNPKILSLPVLFLCTPEFVRAGTGFPKFWILIHDLSQNPVPFCFSAPSKQEKQAKILLETWDRAGIEKPKTEILFLLERIPVFTSRSRGYPGSRRVVIRYPLSRYRGRPKTNPWHFWSTDQATRFDQKCTGRMKILIFKDFLWRWRMKAKIRFSYRLRRFEDLKNDFRNIFVKIEDLKTILQKTFEDKKIWRLILK